MRSPRALVAAVLLPCFAACSSTATIHRQTEPNLEAEISGSSPDALFVLDDRGVEHKIPSETIRTIDHPGNVEAIIGGVLLGLGGLTAASLADDEPEAAVTIGIFYGGPGLALLFTGLARWVASKNAASALEPPEY